MPDLSPDVERELEALDDALAGRRVAPDLTELGELALLLREDRPHPSDGFGRELDHRAAHGFPKGDPRTRASGRRWLAWHQWMGPSLAAGLAALAIAVVVAFPSGSDESGGGGAAETSAESASGGSDGAGSGSNGAGGGSDSAGGGSPELPQDAHASGGSADAPQATRAGAGSDEAASALAAPLPAPSGSPGSDARDRRKVERSAWLTLAARPRDIDTVSARIQDVTRRQGGFVVSSTVSSSRDGGSGEFELRIPTRNLDAAVAALSRLGAVRERSQSAQDITAQSVSARSRLKDARTERVSLLEQLADATTVEETESIRARLRIVSREIERARAEVRRVNNRAAFSTVTVTLVADRSATTPGSEEDDGTWSPGDAANDALRVLEVVVGVALIALAIALPLALIGLFAALTLRFARRRRREHALDAV
jgi:Domain of unknown function (DUF4349)